VPQAEVDDATQQVFLVANDKLAIIRPGSERSFLIAVATRVASHARRSNVRREAARQRFSESPTSGEEAPSPEHLMQRLEARDLLDRVLDKMPADLRSVFVLFELEELSIDEVASLLSLPRGTVATRLRRARVVFREEATALNQRDRGREP
jgi:RNA polymerase sigma-70 factor (ECF subfamily)